MSLTSRTEKCSGFPKWRASSTSSPAGCRFRNNLTIQVADALMKALHPTGVAVVIEAKHLCMMMRGVEKQNSVMKTSCLLGSFKEDARTRSEFLALLSLTSCCVMLLTVSKRLEFSASRRLFVRKLERCGEPGRFGPETAARYGTGRNYVAFFVFSGDVNRRDRDADEHQRNQRRVAEDLHERFDHKFLNEDNPAFADVPPTAENVARQLFHRGQPLFRDLAGQLVGLSFPGNA